MLLSKEVYLYFPFVSRKEMPTVLGQVMQNKLPKSSIFPKKEKECSFTNTKIKDRRNTPMAILKPLPKD
jgi:hypothetical protein